LLKYFSSIGISLDSIKEENYNKIRVGGNYRNLLENIRFLLERNKQLKTKTIISTNYVATHLNFSELEEYLKLCLNFQLNSNVVEVENWYFPYQRQYKEESEFIKESRKFHKKILALISKYKKIFEKNNLYLSYGITDKRKKTCLWPFTSCYISFDGYVTPCCVRQDPAVINFGNIFKMPFKTIWNSRKYKIFRNTMINNLPNVVCDNCPE
jgi:radical SAM protein with 4Fe4S-binding SPASM domain